MTRSTTSFPASTPEPPAVWLGRWFTAARREGFLALLAPAEWQTLSALLSFTCRDGQRRFSVDQLAVAMGLPREQALTRLDRLTEQRWRDGPLALLERDSAGEIVGAT